MEDEEILKITFEREKELLKTNLDKEKEKNKEYKQEIEKLNARNRELQEQLDSILYSRTYKLAKNYQVYLRKERINYGKEKNRYDNRCERLGF